MAEKWAEQEPVVCLVSKTQILRVLLWLLLILLKRKRFIKKCIYFIFFTYLHWPLTCNGRICWQLNVLTTRTLQWTLWLKTCCSCCCSGTILSVFSLEHCQFPTISKAMEKANEIRRNDATVFPAGSSFLTLGFLRNTLSSTLTSFEAFAEIFFPDSTSYESCPHFQTVLFRMI